MSAEGLAGSAVQVLSEYFQGRERTDVGHIAMQDLFTLVAGKLGVGFPHTVFLGFQENPADPVAAAALRLSLEQAIEQDGLRSGSASSKPSNRMATSLAA